MTILVALAGPSRSGKGAVAKVFADCAHDYGFVSFERQLSDNGKWALARIFQPTIRRVEAVAWFEELKKSDTWVEVHERAIIEGCHGRNPIVDMPLQKFLQHGLQDGGRDIFGEHYWTDRIIPLQVLDENWGNMSGGAMRWGDLKITPYPQAWLDGFFDEESGVAPTDLAIISDLRQLNEAERVRDIGGVVIEMQRPDVEDAYRTGADHITERGLLIEVVDCVIVNDGDLDQLRADATKAFKDLVLPRLREAA